MIVRIRMSDGIVGIGEGTTIGGLAYGPESPEGMKVAIDTYFTPILLHMRPNRIGPTMARDRTDRRQGNNFAKCAVETALARCASDKRDWLSAFPNCWSGAFTTSCRSPGLSQAATPRSDIEEAERDARPKRRHNIFKLKIGRGAIRDDVTHVAAIKRALGDRASVRVDVNQAWNEAGASRCLPLLAMPAST